MTMTEREKEYWIIGIDIKNKILQRYITDQEILLLNGKFIDTREMTQHRQGIMSDGSKRKDLRAINRTRTFAKNQREA